MAEPMNIALAHEQFVEALIYSDAPLTKQEQAKLLEQADRLPFHWIRTAYNNAKKHSLLVAVHLAQEGTQLLLNHLHGKLSKTSSPFYEHLQGKLTRFMNYLRRNCPSYFDTQTAMPDNMWHTIRLQTDALLGPGETSVLAETDDELAALLRSRYHAGTQPETPCYHIAEYWQQLAGALNDTLHTGDKNLHTIYTLVACNFNCTVFIKYLLHRFAGALPPEGDVNDAWAEHLRQLNRIIDVPGMCLDTRQKNCKELLFADISNEMHSNSFSRHAAPVFQAAVSFKTSLSVPQLALFYRLQADLGMITIENKLELMDNLARLYKTPAGTLSAKHLRDKFYTIEPSAIAAMKTYAVEMLNLLRTYGNT